MPAGRPSVFKKSMLDKLIKLMSNGETLGSACFDLGIHKDTAYDWMNPQSPRYKPEFSDAYKKAVAGYEKWLIGHMKDAIADGKQVNTTLVVWLSKIVLKWKEEKDQFVSLNVNIPPEQLSDKELDSKLKEALKVVEGLTHGHGSTNGSSDHSRKIKTSSIAKPKRKKKRTSKG